MLRSLYKITGIPVHYLSGDGELTLLHLGGPDEDDPLMDATMKNKLMLPTKDGTPRLYFERGEILSCAFRDNREHWVVLGPVGVLELSRETLAEYARSHNVKEEPFSLPVFDNSADLQKNFETNIKLVLSDAHKSYIKYINDGADKDSIMNELIDSSLNSLKAQIK